MLYQHNCLGGKMMDNARPNQNSPPVAGVTVATTHDYQSMPDDRALEDSTMTAIRRVMNDC